jgi:hypothetical protein
MEIHRKLFKKQMTIYDQTDELYKKIKKLHPVKRDPNYWSKGTVRRVQAMNDIKPKHTRKKLVSSIH